MVVPAAWLRRCRSETHGSPVPAPGFGAGSQRSRGRWVFFAVGVTALLGACTSNRCQRLCDAFYQMELRCALFANHDQYHPLRCEAGANDPQQLRQQADYDIRRCEQDFLNPSCEEQEACCKAVCFEALLEDFDAVVDTRERDYEQKRDLCRKYRELVAEGDAPWCLSLRADCHAELVGAGGTCAAGG